MKRGDGFHCSLDPTAPMKQRSRRLPFTLLILIAAAGTILSCRTAVHGGLASQQLPAILYDSPGAASSSPLLPAPNATLLRLASVDVGEKDARRDIEELLDGNFGVSAGDSRYRSISSWRRQNHHHYHPHLPFEGRPRSSAGSRATPIRLLRFPKDYRVFPEFHRALHDWSRNRRFQPGVMSELVTLVKHPIDQHHGIPPDSSDGRRYGSCAVVGNSGILLRNEHGDLIDGHDLVIRLNNARTGGYQRNVGSKTGLAFVNSNILHLCARRETCFCHPYGEDVPMIMYICQPAHFLDYAVCNASHKAPLLVTDARFDLLCARIVRYYSLQQFTRETGKPPEEWGKVHDSRMFHYSSGMQAVTLALGICERVSIFGFGKSAEAKHHYHTNQKAELSLHDYQAEYAFYRDLIERPQVIPFLSESGFKLPPVVMYH